MARQSTPPKRGRLRRSDCSGEGIRRLGAGSGFTYRDANGERVSDPETLARIKDLAVPPAWREVWICSDPLGHLQATGVDAAGRKQYLYHDRWQARRAEKKFEHARRFAGQLPRLRRGLTADLRLQGMPRERALACAVRLLDLGFFRVGGEAYAEENESFGLATLLREHVTVRANEVVFDFPAKSGQRRVQSIRDPAARRAIETMYRRRSGPEDLLAWRDEEGWHDVRSDDINAYIQERIGDGFTAKDFRTWHGTVLAAVELAGRPRPATRAEAQRAVKSAVSEVSDALGNTPAVCRRSYIDPRVIERFLEGRTIKLDRPPNGRVSARARARIERRVRDLIA